MNLDFLWRQPLQSPQTNKAVTQTSFKISEEYVRETADSKWVAKFSGSYMEQTSDNTISKKTTLFIVFRPIFAEERNRHQQPVIIDDFEVKIEQNQ